MINSFRGKYRFLSNFFTCNITSKDGQWASAEHYYQSRKFLNPKIREKIRKEKYPWIAKRLGKSIPLRKDWDQIKNNIMFETLRLKFDQNIDIQRKLMLTGEEELIEGNMWHDNYWGNCNCPECSHIIGKNILGKLLMKIRKEYNGKK